MTNIKFTKISDMITEKALFDFLYGSIYQTISQLDNEYPLFHRWYHEKVKNDILSGKREILFSIIDDYISGIAILKNTPEERKICTLRVVDQFQHRGIAQVLVRNSFDFLDTEKPLITVSSVRDHQFKSLFDYFGFQKTFELSNYYKLDSSEIVYNGALIESQYCM